jgi:hypothetical protein
MVNGIGTAVPYTGGRRTLPGRDAGRARTQDALYTVKHGRTVLAVVTTEHSPTLNGTGKTTATRYVVVAYGNASRERRSLGSFDTLARATEYVDSYSPRWGLLT